MTGNIGYMPCGEWRDVSQRLQGRLAFHDWTQRRCLKILFLETME